MNKLRWTVIGVAVAVASATLWAQPAINFFNQRLTVDANGALILKAAAYGGSPGPATAAGNLRVKADANNALIATIGSGTITPDTICLDATNQDTCLARAAAGKLTLTGTTPMIQLGGTTSSFPALKRNGAIAEIRLADDSAYAQLTLSNLNIATGISATGILLSTTAPTLGTCAGFGTSPTMGTTNSTASFLANIGTAPPAGGTCTITLPTATTGWNCSGEFRTSTATMKETSTTTTTAVMTVTGTPTASEVAQLRCFAY